MAGRGGRIIVGGNRGDGDGGGCKGVESLVPVWGRAGCFDILYRLNMRSTYRC